MTRQQLTKPIYIWVLTVLIACGLWVIAGKAGIRINPEQNSNSQNSNASNANANRSQNRNTSGSMAGSMSSQDHKFVMEAAMGGLMEVELGRVAAQKGATDAVKQFGQRMVDDHSKVNEELMTLATSKGMTLPAALDEKHRAEVTKMSAMTGANFDRAYGKMMLSDHNKDVKEFEKQSTKGSDPDLKAFAAKNLPTLKEHLQLAKTLPGAGNNSNNSGGGSRSTNRNSNSNSNSNRP
jgi:putative membrane protein